VFHSFHTFAHTTLPRPINRTLARFRTGSHDLAAVIGRWGVERDYSSFHMRQLCSFCRLNRIEDKDHFLFECPLYRHLRSIKCPDLF
jgi:hypothetical protein